MDEQILPQKKYKILKWVISIIAIILMTLSIIAWYVNYKWKPLLTTAIKNSVINATDSLYRVEFSNIDVNILTGSVTVDKIDLTPNLNVYKKFISQRKAPGNLIDLKIVKLSIKNVNPINVYKYRKLDIKEITIEKPTLSVFYTKLKNQIEKEEDKRTPYNRVKNILNEIKIGSIFLSDVKLKYVDQSFKIPKITNLERVNIRLNNILINENSASDNHRIFTAKDVIAEVSDYNYATPDSMYHLCIKHVAISTQKKQLIVEGIGLIPRYKDIAFSNHFSHQKERYNLMFDSLIASNINFNTLIENRTFTASSVKLMNGELNVFLNRDKKARKIDKGFNFPHLALQRVAWGIIADTVILRNLNISYREYNPKTKGRGTIYFSDLDGRIFNVTNDSLALTKNNFADAYLKTLLMGKGKLDIHIGFNLTDQKGAFTYKGELGNMQASTINSITKPLAMIMISSGEINSLTFKMKGNIDGAGGTMTLNYKDLNVILMKKDEQENFKRMGLMSLFANALLLERDNPKKNKPIRVANPYYNRPSDASFFNLMWKAIFAGVKESVGITKEKEAKLLLRIENYKDAKENREQRRLERHQRRDDRNNKN